ncbi:hypothetical protein D3C76_1593350 [compost metagenome]
MAKRPKGFEAQARILRVDAAVRKRPVLPICNQPSVGASLLAMNVNDDAGCLNERGILAFIASKLAPTERCV